MNFERGQDPKEALGIGLKEQVKKALEEIIEEHGSKLSDKDLLWAQGIKLSKKFGTAIKLLIEQQGTFGSYTLIADYKELEEPIKIEFSGFTMPIVKNIVAKTVGQQLVSVQPLSGPVGKLVYLDYKYKNKNLFQRILERIRDAFRKSARY